MIILQIQVNLLSYYRIMGGCHSGGGEVRVVHQNHEDEKNSSEFFEARPKPPRAS